MYPPDIKIPENIRFVGTINKDETTKSLSPKVIDRAFVIELNNRIKESDYDTAPDIIDLSYDDSANPIKIDCLV